MTLAQLEALLATVEGTVELSVTLVQDLISMIKALKTQLETKLF